MWKNVMTVRWRYAVSLDQDMCFGTPSLNERSLKRTRVHVIKSLAPSCALTSSLFSLLTRHASYVSSYHADHAWKTQCLCLLLFASCSTLPYSRLFSTRSSRCRNSPTRGMCRSPIPLVAFSWLLESRFASVGGGRTYRVHQEKSSRATEF